MRDRENPLAKRRFVLSNLICSAGGHRRWSLAVQVLLTIARNRL